MRKAIGRLKKDIHLLAKIKNSKLIVSAGMPRSGSTLLFNMVRLLLLEKIKDDSKSSLSSCWISEISKTQEASLYLVKTHRLSHLILQKSEMALYSYRDVRDALVSCHKKFGKPPSIETVREWISQYNLAKKNSVKMIRYEDMIENMYFHILNIERHLSLNLGEEDMQVICQKLSSIDNQKICSSDKRDFSSDTLLHTNHITGTQVGEWESIIEKKLIDNIHREFKWWFIENQYSI